MTLTISLILRLMVDFSPFININHAINMKKRHFFKIPLGIVIDIDDQSSFSGFIIFFSIFIY